jgi:hypothetical protein
LKLGWNIVGVAVLALAALAARSVALAGFGLDSLIEIGASTVVLWELSDKGEARQRRALRLIGTALVALALYVTVQSVAILAARHHASGSPLGIFWTALTLIVMFALAAGKARTGKALRNPVLITEARVTFIDSLLAGALLARERPTLAASVRSSCSRCVAARSEWAVAQRAQSSTVVFGVC